MLVWWFPHCCGIEVGCYGDFVLATNWHLWSSLRYKTPIVCGAFWLRKCKFLNCQFNYVYQLENDLRFLSDLIRCYTLFFVHFDLQNCIFFGSHLLIFLHGPPKVFFYRIFLLGIFFFRYVFNGWKPDSYWRGASEVELSPFFNISSLWENQLSSFSAEKLRLGNKNWECSRLCWQSFA